MKKIIVAIALWLGVGRFKSEPTHKYTSILKRL
jgi:hypothetical protein